MNHRFSHHERHGRRFGHMEHSQEERHHGRTHGRQRRGGGVGRFSAHGYLPFVILQLIAEKPRPGYELIKAIEEQVAGAYSPSPGVIYPTLTHLEELGYVTVSTGESGQELHE